MAERRLIPVTGRMVLKNARSLNFADPNTMVIFIFAFKFSLKER